MTEPKPVLWVALTDHGRAEGAGPGMQQVAQEVQDAVGDDYHVIAADDRVRLATQEDLRDLRDSIDDLLPSEVETAEERRQQEAERLGGLSPDDVMGDANDALGAQDPASDGHSDVEGDSE